MVPVIVGLAERYKFSKLPQANSLTIQPLDLKFEGGAFVASDGAEVAVNLSILEDGMIAETRASTDESDRFLEDAVSWAHSTETNTTLPPLYPRPSTLNCCMPWSTLFRGRTELFAQQM